MDEFIERRIITGLIVSTDYIQQVYSFWNPKLLATPTSRLITSWCIEYFDQYRKAPGRDIEGIYTQKCKEGLQQDKAEWIEDILEGLSEEYERDKFNVEYLADETRKYFQERHLKTFSDGIRNELDAGNIIEAEEIAIAYTSVSKETQSAIDPFVSATRFKEAFKEREKPLIEFPTVKLGWNALGEFWNQELVRGGFVALMGPEKRGKTFMLMELALQAVKSGCNVVFFQAGDMTEAQQLRRLGIYLAMKSDQARYCRPMYVPVADCKHNQLNNCNRPERQCDFGIGGEISDYDDLVSAYVEHKDYKPCRDCSAYEGSVWFEEKSGTNPVTWKEAYKKAIAFKRRHSTHFKLSTYPNETLTISEIKALLNIWERQENFVPDVIVVDYADILAPDPDFSRLDFRNQNNKIWQRLRSLSQERHCLVITATQASASAYKKKGKVLRMSDFSEDKRKYAHVTAMYGLNQTIEQKKIGIMRINEIVVRDADFGKADVKVLQRLQMGRPFLGSFF